MGPELPQLVPPSPPSPQAVAGHTPGGSLPRRVNAKISSDIQQVITEAIKVKRREIWNPLGGNKRFSPYAAGALMPEKDITSLSKKSMTITTPEHVPKTLGLYSHQYVSSARVVDGSWSLELCGGEL